MPKPKGGRDFPWFWENARAMRFACGKLAEGHSRRTKCARHGESAWVAREKLCETVSEQAWNFEGEII